jgi:hypothetical protein
MRTRVRRATAAELAMRRTLRGRSAGACEMRLAAADCWGWATEVSHRIATGSGGRKGDARAEHDRLSNVIHACPRCHEWCHRNIGLAEALGLMLREGDETQAERAFLPAHGWCVLADDGTWEAA